MKRFLFAIACFALACGGQASDVEQTPDAGPHQVLVIGGPDGSVVRDATPEEEYLFDIDRQSVDDASPAVNEPDGDYGQTAQALDVTSISSIYGQPTGDAFNGCTFPNTAATHCNVPTDKIIKYHWAGPTTDSNYPTINFKTLMQQVISELNAAGTSFSWTEGSSTSSEGIAFSNNTSGALGVTAVPIGSDIVVNGNHYGRFNSCDTRINLNVTIQQGWKSFSASDQVAAFKKLFKHEFGHCAGFNDFDIPNAPVPFTADPLMMYFQFRFSPSNFSNAEKFSMTNFRP